MQRSQRHRRKPRRLILIIIAILLIIMGVRHFSSTNARLKSAWNKIIFTSNNNVSIAVYSPKTHQIYTSSNAPQHKFRTASTVKVSILAGILAKQQSHLTSHQKSLATKMIEQSDNDSTSELFEDYLGGKNGLQQTFEKFGMTQSRANSSWGLTVTTPKDQVKLLNNIFYKSKVLSDEERSEIRDLMGNVENDQAWGISASSDNFALKNGWLNYGKDEWIVNSIGYVKNSNGTDYTIAVYTDKNQSMAAGQQVIEQLARVTKPILD